MRALPTDQKRPQMQWNRLDRTKGPGETSAMLAGLGTSPWVYFVHSTLREPSSESESAVVATCEYGTTVVAAVEHGSLWGTQFHPEKSSRDGPRAAREFRRSRRRGSCRDLTARSVLRRRHLGGEAVRLTRGDFGIRTDHGDPVALALHYVRSGARTLHVVDLDAARGGEPVNRAAVLRIIEESGVPVQVGGGAADRRRRDGPARFGGRTCRGLHDGCRGARGGPELATRYPGRLALGLDHRRQPASGGDSGDEHRSDGRGAGAGRSRVAFRSRRCSTSSTAFRSARSS